jgi:hypothetical protein
LKSNNYKGKSLPLNAITQLVFDKKNITEIKTVYSNGYTIKVKLTFDQKHNLFLGLPFVLMDLFPTPFSTFTNYNKNNILQYDYTEYTDRYEEVQAFHFNATHTYIYNKQDFPLSLSSQSSNDKFIKWNFQY